MCVYLSICVCVCALVCGCVHIINNIHWLIRAYLSMKHIPTFNLAHIPSFHSEHTILCNLLYLFKDTSFIFIFHVPVNSKYYPECLQDNTSK